MANSLARIRATAVALLLIGLAAVAAELAWSANHRRDPAYNSPQSQKLLTSMDLALFSGAALVTLLGAYLLAGAWIASGGPSAVPRFLRRLCLAGIALLLACLACGLYGIVSP